MTKGIVDKKLVSIVAFEPHSFSGLGSAFVFKLELLSKNVTFDPSNEIYYYHNDSLLCYEYKFNQFSTFKSQLMFEIQMSRVFGFHFYQQCSYNTYKTIKINCVL